MSEFDIDPGIRAVVRQRLFRNSVPLGLLAVAVGIGISAAQAGAGNLPVFFVVIPIGIVAVSIGMYNGYRRQVKQLESFRLSVSPEQAKREMLGVPPLTVHRENVQRIELHSSGEITIKTSQIAESIRIPSHVRQREVLLRELSAWCTPEPAPSVASPVYGTVAGLAVLAAFATVMLSRKPAVVIVVGSGLFLALVACCVLIWRNKQIDARIRRLALTVLLPAAAVLAQVIAAIRAVNAL